MRNSPTLDLLERIAAANGVAIDDFLIPQGRAATDRRSRMRYAYRGAVMLPRFVRAYWALPGRESRLRVLRMMETMADRAKDARDETALAIRRTRGHSAETQPNAATAHTGFLRKVSGWISTSAHSC